MSAGEELVSFFFFSFSAEISVGLVPKEKPKCGDKTNTLQKQTKKEERNVNELYVFE